MSKEKIKTVLFGNPNSGKTTIFNKLSGSHQKVANWSGVTVESKKGKFSYREKEIEIIDLPGVYSLTPSSGDEVIVRDYIINEQYDIVVAIVDANNLERNLYPVIQLLELNKSPVILVLNMMDEIEKKGLDLDIKVLSDVLGIDIIETVAVKGTGVEELKNAIVKGSKKVFFSINYGIDIENARDRLVMEFPVLGDIVNAPAKWTALKFLEGDGQIMSFLERKVSKERLEKVKNAIEKRSGIDLTTKVIEHRYAFIRGMLKEVIRIDDEKKNKKELSDSLDRILTHSLIGIPVFLIVMFIIFQFVFKLGAPAQGLIEGFIGSLTSYIREIFVRYDIPLWVNSLINDGIISGVGSVVVFLPNIMILFFFMSILEDTGYMGRVAFVMDKIMHKMGLHGKSFIPMILGFGCSVPAIMSTRILETRKDRVITALVLPFMSCSARLPVYILFSGVFFGKNAGIVIMFIYVFGILTAFFSAKVLKRYFFANEETSLIIELPPYRGPDIDNSLIHMWLKAKEFLQKAGTIIFASVVVVWFLSSVPFGVEYASEHTLLGQIGKFFAPLFSWAGFGNWKVTLALITGIIAKEQVVSTLGTLLSPEGSLQSSLRNYFTPLTSIGFMLMTLIYTPCIAALVALKRELGIKWMLFSLFYSLILGWVLAVIIFNVGKFIGFA